MTQAIKTDHVKLAQNDRSVARVQRAQAATEEGDNAANKAAEATAPTQKVEEAEAHFCLANYGWRW